MKSLLALAPRKILIRSTNWVGDAVMTTPALHTIRRNFSAAHLAILAYPWVADVFAASPDVDEVILFDRKGRHRGMAGLWRLAGELRPQRFEAAILLQNAFEAAFIACLAGIPARAGYRRDARSPLLTHGVGIDPAVRRRHQVFYYQEMLRGLGLEPGPDRLTLTLAPATRRWAKEFVQGQMRGAGPVVGLNPGAAYGPAKRWPAESYAALAGRLVHELDALVLVFGTEADRQAAALIKEKAPARVVDLTGRTTLAEAMALIGVCQAFVSNDSGLMHVAAAQRVPMAAIFGSTDAVATGPFADNSVALQQELDCIPCLATHCRRGDYRCMTGITVDRVFETVAGLLAQPGEK